MLELWARGLLDSSDGLLDGSWQLLEPSEECLWASWGRLGDVRGALEAILGGQSVSQTCRAVGDVSLPPLYISRSLSLYIYIYIPLCLYFPIVFGLKIFFVRRADCCAKRLQCQSTKTAVAARWKPPRTNTLSRCGHEAAFCHLNFDTWSPLRVFATPMVAYVVRRCMGGKVVDHFGKSAF